ncbi:hypothetical protein B0H14DRAFT_2330589 [Mycena olivaceomarginata]|nr:hypothetical protein B0H14DRAFT_2330589 [Mycena olivaceomarginata]
MSALVVSSPASVIDLVLQCNEWAELAHSNPEQLLNILLTALDTPNSPSLTDPSVEQAFKFHLEYLTPAPSSSVPNSTNGAPTHTIPSLYSILKTFWLPSSPSYFALATSAASAYTPSPYCFLYWDPQPLVLNRIACPACTAPLANCGCIRSGPFTIHDLAGPFFVIGCTYVCTANSAHVYASTDAAVWHTLPAVLNHDFSVHLVGGDTGVGPDVWNWQARGVSRALWNLVLGALHAGLAWDKILQLVRGVQHGVPEVVGMSEENGAAEEDVNTDADAALIEKDESTEELAEGHERKPGDLPLPWARPMAPQEILQLPPRTKSSTTPEQPTLLSRASTFDIRPTIYCIATTLSRFRTAWSRTWYRTTPHSMHSMTSLPAKNTGSPRYCCKCGLQTCKGKDGYNFCTNVCKDCNNIECLGRNSQWPDKGCESGWSKQLPQGEQPV